MQSCWEFNWYYSVLHCLIRRKKSSDHRTVLLLDIYQILTNYDRIKKDGLTETFLTARHQGVSKDLETACPKLAISKFEGILLLKGHHNKLRLNR